MVRPTPGPPRPTFVATALPIATCGRVPCTNGSGGRRTVPRSITWLPLLLPCCATADGLTIFVLGGPAFTPTLRTLFIVAPPPDFALLILLSPLLVYALSPAAPPIADVAKSASVKIGRPINADASASSGRMLTGLGSAQIAGHTTSGGSQSLPHPSPRGTPPPCR